ncbi:MAG: AMP-binding protein, partial [Ruminococcus sp.]|nr:AMP-binding protein [Ruminococcus sp.]
MKSKSNKVNKIQNIYSLTPMQEGMLFHYLQDTKTSEYVVQEVYITDKVLDESHIKAALELLSMRFDVMRTSIVYEKLKEPRQLVYKERNLEYSFEDISSYSYEEQDELIEKIVADDLKRGINLQRDTLVRLKYIKSNEKSRLLWTSHHIILDGWCSQYITSLFNEYYQALSSGVSVQKLKIQIAKERASSPEYVDFINWLKNQDKNKARKYWSEVLDGYDNVAEIKPSQIPEPTKEQMKRMAVKLSDDTLVKIVDLIKQEQITPNIIAMAACGILLQRYTNEDDVVFGLVVSGRNADISGIEDIVGLFVNTIPVRVCIKKETTLRELLRSLQKQNIESSSYDYCALTDIQSASNTNSDLIKVLFTFENFVQGQGVDSAESEQDNLMFSLEFAREQTNYGISIGAMFTDDVYAFNIMFNPNEYCDNEIYRLLNNLVKICDEIAEKIDIPVVDIEMTTEEEKQRILVDFNSTDTDYPKDKTIVELFEEQAAKTPENIAVVFEEEKLTYAELNAKANSLAHKLRELGVKSDDFVAIIADRSIEMIAGIYGIIKSGGAYVPIDPTYPEDRIAFMLEDCAPKAVLKYTSESIDLKTEVPVIDLGSSDVWNGNYNNPELINKPNDLAYCIYTSGTTGKPKGVIIEHHGVVSMYDYLEKLYEVTEEDNVLQFANYIFDASVWEMTLALYSGATLVLISSDKITDTAEFEKYVFEKNVSLTLLPPQFFRQTDVKSFRTVTTGGSASDRDIVMHVKENCR